MNFPIAEKPDKKCGYQGLRRSTMMFVKTGVAGSLLLRYPRRRQSSVILTGGKRDIRRLHLYVYSNSHEEHRDLPKRNKMLH